MTEQIQDQLSAFVDDELPYDECDFLVRRLALDRSARKRIIRYEAIGAALRGEPLASYPGVLGRRLHEAIDAGSELGNPSRRSRARLVGALFVLAGAALLAAAGFRAGYRPGAAELVSQSSLQEVDVGALPGYAVPAEVAEQRLASPTVMLTHYLLQHGEYASRVGHASVDSHAVISADFDLEDAPQ